MTAIRPTAEQQAIIDHTHGHALVFAVAGSGKTTTMVRRIVHLIQQHRVRPQRILACTFSRMATRAIEQSLAKHPGTQGVKVCTLNSLATQILNEARRMGLTTLQQAEPGFSRHTFYRVRKELIEEGFTDKRHLHEVSFENFQTYLDSQKAQLHLPYVPSDLPDWAKSKIQLPDRGQDLYADFYERHDTLRRLEQKVDFADSFIEAWTLMAIHEPLRRVMADRWDYIHVDEFQDVNSAQNEMLDLLASNCHSYLAIGDDDQTIYQWRGAEPKYILNFTEQHQAETFRLTTNFRCPMGVIALANGVIQKNTVRDVKQLRASRGGNGVFLHEHEPGKAAHVAIEALHNGHSPQDIVILVRTYAQTAEQEQIFIKECVPYRIVGTTPFYERDEIKLMLGYLRLALTDLHIQKGRAPTTDQKKVLREDLLQVMNVPNRFLSRLIIDRLSQSLWTGGRTLAKALQELEPHLQYSSSDSVASLRAALEELTDSIGFVQGKEALLQFAGAIQLADHYARTAPVREFGEEKMGSVRALAEMAQERSLADLVRYISELSRQGQHRETLDKDDDPRVTMMTALRAKGLEWPVVIVPDCNEGLYRRKPSEDRAAAEEERRIFYVALTRCQQELHLITEGEETTPFLTEIDYQNVVQEHDLLCSVLDRDVCEWSAADTHIAASLLQKHRHDRYLQSWVPEQVQEQILHRFHSLHRHLSGQPRFQGQAETLALLDISSYDSFVPNSEAVLFPDLAILLQSLKEQHSAGTMQSSGRQAGLTLLQPEDAQSGLEVHHARFGAGFIISVKGKGKQTEVTVDFPMSGMKRMVVIYANLLFNHIATSKITVPIDFPHEELPF